MMILRATHTVGLFDGRGTSVWKARAAARY